MNNPYFKYYLLINGVEQEVNPLNLYAAKLHYSKPDELIYNFMESFDGELVFAGLDYEFLSSIEFDSLDNIAEFIMRSREDNFTSDFIRMTISKRKIKWDEVNQIAKVIPEINSLLNDIINDWEEEKNILNISTRKTLHSVIHSKFEFALTIDETGDINTSIPPPGLAWDWASSNNIDYTYYIWVREICSVKVAGTGWMWDETSGIYARKANLHCLCNDWSSALITTTNSTKPSGGKVELIGEAGGYWFWVDRSLLPDVVYDVDYTQAIDLRDVFNELLSSYGLTIKSTFFWNDDKDDGTTYPDYNYVANEVEPGSFNELKYLHLIHNSDAKKPGATEPATKGYISLKKLLSDLNIIFGRLYFFIDKQGFARIEHFAYFQDRYGTDLTTLMNSIGRLFTKNMQAYEYEKTEIEKYETIVFPAGIKPENINGRIERISQASINSTKERRIENIATDLEGLQEQPSEFPDDGFILVIANSNDYIVFENNISTGKNTLNGHLGKSNLYHFYHRYNSPTPLININNNIVSALSVMRSRKQSNIYIPYWKGFDFSLLYKTEINWGEIDEAELELANNFLMLNLLFD